LTSTRTHIITADDLGLDQGTNEAIAAAFDAGLIDSTSVMAGMPAFELGVKLAQERGFAHAIGVHLTLSEGWPLTDAIRHLPRFCDANGQYAFRVSRSELRLTRAERAAVYAELRSQIERCRDAGLQLTHLDSHHHTHNVWPIGQLVIDLARRYRIPTVRLARNMGPEIGALKRAFKTAYNARLRGYGLARSDLMGSVSDYIYARPRPSRRAELMVHPALVDGVLVDRLEHQELEPLLRRAGLC
jgi:predicted glycoside hydrolase/deacetylase ChbG (UPF0249 family)